MKIKFFLIAAMCGLFALSVSAQLNLPRESQRSSVSQVIGDANVTIVYNRPNIKGRKAFGELVPFDQVWRTGANEATVFEVSQDVKINGQTLPAGKYSLHTIPTKKDWTLIFSKKWDQWGSFNYDAKDDALRVTVTPKETGFHETLAFEIKNVMPTTADIYLVWDKLAVPFTVDAGDVTGRTLAEIRKAIAAKADDPRPLLQGASWVYQNKIAGSYEEALGWTEKALALRESYSGLLNKARLLAALNRKDAAIATAEKAIAMGKAATPPVDTSFLEQDVQNWKKNK